MTKPWKPCLPLLVALLAATPVLSNEGHSAPSKSNPSFDRLKVLVGEWEADAEGGHKMREQITLTGGGAVLMENMFPGTPHAMVTMYHPDGNSLVATHYCAGGNQPRMRSSGFAPDGKKVSFVFADATNMASPTESHMHQVDLELIDADHFDATWTSKGEGPEAPKTFHWTRVKPAAK